MQRAWLYRRFMLPLAGVVCSAGLSLGVELFQPPRPPVDTDGVELDSRARRSPQPVTIEPLSAAPTVHSPVDEDLDGRDNIVYQPNSSIPFPPQRREPIPIPPPDPMPIIESPLAVYPESLPPVYAPGCAMGIAPTCAQGVYDEGVYTASPSCGAYDNGNACGVTEQVCGCSCVPNWTIRAEAIIWDRAGSTSVPLIAAPVAVNSADLDGGWRAGPRLTAIKHGIFDSCWDLEVSYFGINGWSGTQTVAGATTYLTTPPLVFAAAPLQMTYTSELQNFEVNGRRAYNDWVTWFVGFRALNVDELLTASVNAGASTHTVATRNRLYGGQVGLDAVLFDGDCWYVNAVGKAGIYSNSGEQVTQTAGFPGAQALINFNGNQTSFVGQLGFNANRRLTDRLTFVAGYNLLWVTGLALAPNQLAATNVNTGAGALSTNGTMFYHGVNVGLEYAW
ncbi:hypothetical protein [Anatilimnocola floriformis]|uniref:hypothetical protein n=1 Tax=Anatilimnocola floriformis TaxID=2948575 RepID=UPI0020C33194|nr:hypothetical protein [Anatilimnocola floriformis]